jgi:hypothetical protein
MAMNRKGYIFSFIALLIVFMAAFLTKPTAYSVPMDEQRFIEERIMMTTNNIQQFRQGFFSSAATAVTKSALEGLAHHRAHGGYMQYYNSRQDFEKDLKTAILYGNVVSPTNQNITLGNYPGVDLQYSLMELLEKYEELAWRAQKINYTFSRDIDDYDFELTQDDRTGPFSIRFKARIKYSVQPGYFHGTRQIAVWNLEDTIEVVIPISGMKDPLLLINSGGAMERRINPFLTERYDRQVFAIFLSYGQYIRSTRGISYIGRFYGSKDYHECCGIISGINESIYRRYPIGGLNSPEDVSYIDCEYFPYPSATSLTCRDPMDLVVYAVRDITNSTAFGDVEGSFPLTITPTFALEVFNMTMYDRLNPDVDGDLIDVYSYIYE